jgi:hypothetical protein
MTTTRTVFALALLSAISAFTCPSATAVTPQEEIAAGIIARWTGELRDAVAIRPKLRFVNPSREVFLAQLRKAASQYHFKIVNVQILRPKQDAPLVIVRTDDEAGLSSATAAILRLVDPPVKSSGSVRVGYEGFLFEVLDRMGLPCLVTSGIRRAHIKGGQWARPPCHFPYAHG